MDTEGRIAAAADEEHVEYLTIEGDIDTLNALAIAIALAVAEKWARKDGIPRWSIVKAMSKILLENSEKERAEDADRQLS